ncbi:hypothetical protein SFC66_04340 [Terribacillus saccharophilus]|uniref:hypothetical protein n=1 Tax=Terribacillus saccharophilus TaxID=361277 RepID=UPI003982D105
MSIDHVDLALKSKSFKQRQSNEPFLLSSILRCPDCDNKGSAACKANSVKAYDAENDLIQRIECFLCFLVNKQKFQVTIRSLTKHSIESLSKLKKDLTDVDLKLKDVIELRNKYLEAFEQNLFPVPVLQERLQQVAIEKTALEQKKNQLIVEIGKSDTKVIPPELVQILLERFIEVYKSSSRENKSNYSNS